MKIPLQVASRDFELTEAIRTEIEAKAEKLERLHEDIIRCRVVLETPHRHKHEGILYNVRIELTIPGSEIVIKREPHEDLYVAIRQAFDAAGRRLEEAAGKRRGDVKRPARMPVGRVSAIFPDKGYGFLTTEEGREIYFHKNSVLNDHFKGLQVGTEVRYVEEEGEKGPQASTVALLRL